MRCWWNKLFLCIFSITQKQTNLLAFWYQHCWPPSKIFESGRLTPDPDCQLCGFLSLSSEQWLSLTSVIICLLTCSIRTMRVVGVDIQHHIILAHHRTSVAICLLTASTFIAMNSAVIVATCMICIIMFFAWCCCLFDQGLKDCTLTHLWSHRPRILSPIKSKAVSNPPPSIQATSLL